MKKRLLAALLAFCMTVSLFPMQAMAAAAGNTSALGSLGIRQISSTAYSISPDVREYEWVLNNGALTQQMIESCTGEVILVSTSDKFTHSAPFFVASLNKINTFITDGKINMLTLYEMRDNRNIKVIVTSA